ncbi:MAG: hypothetical protein KDD26_04495 [Winogradskyella sp.]|nr:hypothetical protein [Winogradskyella sp.]
MISETKKLLALILLFLITGIKVNSQNVNIDIATERNLMSKNTSAKIEAEGSPYIDEEFKIIKIEQYQGQTFIGRYNAYNDEMEVKLDDEKIVALDNSSNYKVTFTNSSKTYKTFSYTTENGDLKQGFLVLIEENDNFSLLKREQIKFYDKEKAASTYQKDKPATFRRENDSYYLKLGDKITLLPQKKSSLLKEFPENSDALKTFIKKNKINLKKEEDLKKLSKYLSTL